VPQSAPFGQQRTVEGAEGGTMHIVPLAQQKGEDEGQAKRFRPAAQVVSRCVITEAVVRPKARAVKRMFRRDMVSEMRKEGRKKAQIE